MFTALDFKKAYTDYMKQYKEYMANMSLSGRALNLFGFKGKISKESGFEDFFSEMKTAVAAVCAENPDTDTADGIVEVIFNTRGLYADDEIPEVQFIAVEGTMLDLIPFMSRGKAEEIYKRYSEEYPKYRRLPVQKQLINALKKAAG